MKNEAVFTMPFGRVYSLLVAKAERKGRTRAEVDEIIGWMTGYTPEKIASSAQSREDYRSFFAGAPAMNERRFLVHGTVCGVRIDDIDDPLMKDIRILDKMIDELARGKEMERILR